jgi:hypothetical protein
MGRIRVVVVAAFIGLFAFVPSPADAQGGTAADCSISVPVHFSPGVTLTPTSGTETSHGETGSIRCTGRFDGHRVTGPGTFGYEGEFTQITCLSDGIPLSGRYSFTIPTESGPQRFAGSITDARIGLVDQFRLSQPEAQFTGIALIVPTAGECVLTPVTDIVISMFGSFTGDVRHG